MADPVRLAQLAGTVGGTVVGDGAVPITDVVHDSRRAGSGVLFVAIVGSNVDGHRFAADAGAAGSALCVQRLLATEAPQLVVPDTRSALGPLAAEVHGHPADRLLLVGVTGTNGKTMVTRLLEAVWRHAGRSPGVMGTLGARRLGIDLPLERTTPEASDTQRLLADMLAAGVDAVAMEVSSHALALRRVDGMRFDVAAFTNLSQDHLDFHGDMDRYFAAKADLFAVERSERAVIWIDDPWGARLAAEAAIPVTTVGRRGEVAATDVAVGLTASSFRIRHNGAAADVVLRFGGAFNVANALVAAGCALVGGLDLGTVSAGLGEATAVAGRFEAVETGADFHVIVDYAHTPDGIRAVIESTRPLVTGRVIVVVGAGGDRDPAKRPLMGVAAAAGDAVVVTSDNPRHEDPAAIVAAVAAGARDSGAAVMEEVDRRAAIRRAVQLAEGGDVVLILGKGHERVQEFAGQLVPFDDRVVAREEVLAR